MPNTLRVLCASLLLVSGSISHASPPIPLIIPPPQAMEPEATGIYYEKALQLALAKTASPADAMPGNGTEYKITYHHQVVGRERYRLLVKQGVVDVMWSSTNNARERELVPVKFNLLRGINEYRVLLIRKDDQPRFDKVKTLADLRQFRIGSGTHWSDTAIYKHNNLPLVTSFAFDTMFKMLAAKRFDYMARSLQEIDGELATYGHLGLAVEKNLMIHYPQPIYFFLNKNNHALAKRIERGLLLAEEDGSLHELFMTIPSFRTAEERLRHINHRIIELRRND